MIRTRPGVFAAAATMTLLTLTACNDATSPNGNLIDVAFLSAPAGFSEVNSSFAGDGAPPMAFMPGMARGAGLAGPHGPRAGFGLMGGPGGGVMGGGLDLAFVGGVPFGRGPHDGPFADASTNDNCAFANGDVTCTNTRNGLTITRVMTWKTANGTAQQRPDSTTNSARAQISVSGTVTRRDSATSVVQHRSDRTVTGLAVGSTQRTVNGTSSGTETTTGVNRDGKAFTARRVAGDTVVGVIVPMQDGRPTYPTAGTVTRAMSSTVTVDGTATTRRRREVVTYNGSATATVIITVNGESKTCALPLPRGRLVCE